MTAITRRIVAEPVRTASETWKTILDLLAPNPNSTAKPELLAVSGVASSLIAAETVKDAPIVVFGNGTQVRIYCLYGEDAIVGEDANESELISSPISGDWAMSLPCIDYDLEWVQAALKKRSKRVTARDMSTPVNDDEENTCEKSAKINMETFLQK